MAYQDFLHDFEETIRTATARLQEISADDSRKSANGEWSPKQIVGHLIDSAANNHQRTLSLRPLQSRADAFVLIVLSHGHHVRVTKDLIATHRREVMNEADHALRYKRT